MSLINEALKKAQRERTPHDATHSADSGASSRTGTSGRSAPSLKIVLSIVVGGAVLVSASVFGTIYLLRKPVSSISIQGETRALPKEAKTGQIQDRASSTAADAGQNQGTSAPPPSPGSIPPAEQRPIQLSVPSATTAQNQTPHPGTQTTSVDSRAAAPNRPATVSGNAASVGTTGKSVEKDISDPSAARSPHGTASLTEGPPSNAATPAPDAASSANSAKASTSHAAPADPVPRASPSEAATPAKSHPPSPAAQAFVNQLKVNGIRASGADSKVLINDRVYRLNDLIDPALGLRLTEVTTDRLVFKDVHGNIYLRNF